MSGISVFVAVLALSAAVVSAAPIHRLPRLGDTPIPYTNCGSSSDLLTLTAVTANAWPPVKGADLTITAQGTLSQAVTDGTYEIKATYLGITILDQKGDLSDLVQLPLAAGPVTISKTENLPSITPSGTINIQITANDNQGHEIVCLKVVANIKKDVAVSDAPIPYTNCGSSSDLLTVSSVTANAWPPVKGADLTITAQGTLSQAVSDGTYEIKATFLGITILDQKGDLSDLVQLPLAAGPVTISKTENLPSITPSGTINIQITANDNQGHEIVCLKVVANIPAKESAVILPHRELVLPSLNRFGDVHVPYTDCATGTLMPVTGIVASSWPPVSGASITLQTSFNAKEEVTGGEYEAKVEYFGIVLQDNTKPLDQAGFVLPIKVGPLTLTQTLDVPTGLPSGEITEIISAKDTAGNKLFCVQISFTV